MNKNKELQERCEDYVGSYGTVLSNDNIEFDIDSCSEFIEKIIKETKDSMGSIQSQLVEAYKKGRADEAKDKPILDEFSRDIGTKPPKSEPVDVENAIKDLDCLNDYINSVHNKIPYVVKMNLYGLSNNIRCEVRNMLRISQSPRQTKEQ